MNKKALALWAAMATASLAGKAKTSENPANFEANKNSIEAEIIKSTENNDKTYNFAEFLADKVKRVVAQDTVKKGVEGGGLDFEPSNLEDLKAIAEKLQSVVESYEKVNVKNLSPEDGKEAVDNAERYLQELISIQKDLDDFFSRDIGNNPNNTNMAIGLSNYLAEIVGLLQERIRWIREAEKDLYSHKDLVGLARNSSYVNKTLIAADAYDKNNLDNAFNRIPKKFKETDDTYDDLMGVKKELSGIYAKLRDELSKTKKLQDLRKINKLQIAYFTAKNKFLAKKLELLNKSIPADLAVFYNHSLDLLGRVEEGFNKGLEAYQKERETIMDEILIPGASSNYLEKGLLGNPYNLQEAVDKRDLDEILNILAKYLNENQVLLRYKTDDWGDSFGSKLEKGNAETFDNINPALESLKWSIRRSLQKQIKNYVESVELLEKSGEDGADKLDKDAISKYILEEINKAIRYMNAERLYKEIQKRLEFSAKKEGKTPLNKKLEKERLYKKHLKDAFSFVGVDYEKDMKIIRTEENKVQPELYLNLAKAQNELVILQNRLTELKKDLAKTREIYKREGFESDSVIAKKEKLINETMGKIVAKETEVDNLKEELRKSFTKELLAWQELEDNDSQAFNKTVDNTAELANEVDSTRKKLYNAKISFRQAKKLYDQALKINNAEALLANGRGVTDENLAQNDELLLKIERRLLDLENQLKKLESLRLEGRATMNEIDRFERTIDREMVKIKRSFEKLN